MKTCNLLSIEIGSSLHVSAKLAHLTDIVWQATIVGGGEDNADYR
jgi:hypothetical protein